MTQAPPVKSNPSVGTHLWVRSAYTLLKGTMSIETLVQTAVDAGYGAIALSDFQVMHGIPEFIRACQRHAIKPILGLECDLSHEGRRTPSLLIARDYQGYQALIKLSSLFQTQKQSLEFSELKPYQSHLFIIVLGAGGPFEEALFNNDLVTLKAQAQALISLIPELFIAISAQDDAYWNQQNAILKSQLVPLGYRSVALHQIQYAHAHDDGLMLILTGIEKGLTLSDPNLTLASHRYLLDPNEYASLYSQSDRAASDWIAEQCASIQLPSKTFLPKFDTPQGIDSQHYLTQLCLQGLKKRLEGQTDPAMYRSRLKHELDVIFSMHYEDYFLIVWDFIRYAKTQGIYVGPGRGSAAGSLVAYVLGITHVDPLVHHLLFERFLNPERVSMPDIDTDFPDGRRDEVLAYVLSKYGPQHVAHIATFGSLAAKQVLRDVGKVMEIAARDLDSLSKAIPAMPKTTLAMAYEQSKAFKQLVDSSERFKTLFDTASALEGLPRHISTHAAGIVMSSVDLNEVVPLIQIESDMPSTQYTMEHLESLGLIKMDFLGLRNLTIIDDVVQAIRLQSQADFNILKIPMDDPATLELIGKVDTVGVFQLESEGMKNLLRQMKAHCFDDIVATIALFRPGPMENIPVYLAARKDPSKVNYLHADLKPILESTSGILIYQEQIMQVAQIMAGFSLAKADILRKAMSKKNSKDLEALKQAFIQGSIDKGYSEGLAQDVYALILKFANYGFNKSHSVAYAMISYQMAYLKANHPILFFIALLNSVAGSEDKTFEYLTEIKQHQLKILSPSVNASCERFVQEGEAIRFPLIIIKSVGTVGAREIQAEQAKGPFTSFHDFVVRISTRKVNRNTLEALIDAGACDDFNLSRSTMRASLEDALDYAAMVRIDKNQQTVIDLNLVKPLPLIEVADHLLEKAEREKAVLGFYLGLHPISLVKEQQGITNNLLMLKPAAQAQTFIGMVKKIKQHRTKTGAMMAFVTLYDEVSELDLAIMPQIYQGVLDQLKTQSFVKVSGLIEKEGSCLVKRLEFIQLDSSKF